MSTNSDTLDVIEVVTEHGDTIAFRSQQARQGNNTYWATLAKKSTGERYWNRNYGVTVSDQVISELPSKVTVNVGDQSVEVKMKYDLNKDGNRRVRGTGKVTVPGHGDKQFMLRISETKTGNFNLNGIIRGFGGGGKGQVLDEL